MRTDRQTDMTTLIVSFRNYAKAPNNRFSRNMKGHLEIELRG
jgi:hypothetical protein